MERLMKWENGHAYYPRCFEKPCYGGGCVTRDCPFETAICERLAAYEDTGLMPEQVVNAKTIIESAFADDTSKAERIRKLVAADDEGRVVVLPPENYDWKIRGDIALGIIAANCRRAEAERAMQEMRASNGRT